MACQKPQPPRRQLVDNPSTTRYPVAFAPRGHHQEKGRASSRGPDYLWANGVDKGDRERTLTKQEVLGILHAKAVGLGL